jgi:hypothetical protein
MEGTVKRLAILFVIIVGIGSCTTLRQPKTLGQIKSELDCVQYKEEMSWNQASQMMGPPDIAPIPEPGTDLSKNTRIYRDKTIIFYIDMREVKEEGTVRFQEVVTNVEFCKKK